MAANDYHGYLRNHMDMEHGGESRFQPTHNAHRPLIFGTLAVIGLLQVASSVTMLLHLTGYLREVSRLITVSNVDGTPDVGAASKTATVNFCGSRAAFKRSCDSRSRRVRGCTCGSARVQMAVGAYLFLFVSLKIVAQPPGASVLRINLHNPRFHGTRRLTRLRFCHAFESEIFRLDKFSSPVVRSLLSVFFLSFSLLELCDGSLKRFGE